MLNRIAIIRRIILIPVLVSLAFPVGAGVASVGVGSAYRHHHSRWCVRHRCHWRHRRHTRAHRATVGHGWVRVPLYVALTKAHELWGTEPCEGHYRIELVAAWPREAVAQAESEGGGEIEGFSTWDSPTGPGFTSPPSTWTNCVMRLDAALWTPHQLETAWAYTCTVLLHEWGLLTGHPEFDAHGAGAVTPGETIEQQRVMQQALPEDDPRCGETA